MRLGLLLLISILYCTNASSQTVVVTDDGTYTTGNTSSVLDVKSISKGFLMPRMTSAQRTAISSPATGLLVYQTDGTPGFYHYDGSTWKVLSTTTNTIGVANGGTGLTSATLGDMLYASAANTISNLAGNTTATKKFITQTGNGTISAAPGWNTIVAADIPDISATYSPRAGSTSLVTLGTVATGTWNATAIGVTKGGTGLTTATLGDIRYGSAANTLAALAGNITTTKKFLTQTGNGTVSAAPGWNTLASTDIPDLSATYAPAAGSASIATVGTINTGTWNATTIAPTKGGTGLTSYVIGDIPYASAANTLSNLAGNATTAKKVLTQTGTGAASAAPAWGTLVSADIPDIATTYSPIAGSSSITTLGTIATGTWNATTIAPTKGGTGLTSYTIGDIPYASAANTLSTLTGNISATKKYLTQAGNGTVSNSPVWDDLTTADISDIATTYSPIAGSSSITTLGTITTGTWNATTIGVTKGGTGLTTVGLGEISYGSASNVMSNLAGNTTATKKFLTQTGTGSTSAAPGWNTLAATDMPTGIDAASIGSGTVTSTEYGYLANVTSDVQTQINNKEDAWTTYQVTGTNATTTGTTLVDVTGLVTGTLLTSTSYEFEAVLSCSTTAVTTGTKYGVNVTVTPTIALAQFSGAVTSTTGGITTTNTNNASSATTFLTTSAQSGIIIIKGIFTTASTGSPVFSIRHLKVTSGTSTVKIGSILRVRAL